MTTTAQWIAGARPRTLPAAIAPVAAGTGAAAFAGTADLGRAALAAAVALALQIAVNYANDYSDGIRGTDEDRCGPMRLVGSGAASASAVKRAAITWVGIGCLAGLTLVALSGQWWLLAIGAGCVAATWFYTGGKNPYGYKGFGELVVFICFGLVATIGTTFTQIGWAPWVSLTAATACGLMSVAILLANNIRDIPTDRLAGKQTLAVRVGDDTARKLFTGALAGSVLACLATAMIAGSPWPALGALAAFATVPAVAAVHAGKSGADLIPALGATGIATGLVGILLGSGLALA